MTKTIKHKDVYERKLQILDCMDGKTSVQIKNITGLTMYVLKNTIKLMRMKGIRCKCQHGKNRSYKWYLSISKTKAIEILNAELQEIEVCSICGDAGNFHYKHGVKTDICKVCHRIRTGKDVKSEGSSTQYAPKLQHNGAPWFIISSECQGIYKGIDEQRQRENMGKAVI